jgi:hypothetical protein
MKVLEKNSKAFKEWAVVVDDLASGRQVVLFRKGGIHEGTGGFEVEEREFFLFPTYEHQNKEELIPEVHSRLDEIIKNQSKDGKIHFQYYATVQAVHKLTDITKLDKLEGHHIWTKEVLKERFEWGKEKMIFALILRVFHLPKEMTIANRADFGGCKSWVDFQESFSTEGTPVLSNAEYHQKMNAIEKLLS